MGNSSSKGGKVKTKKKGTSDDGCIGNRRVRTIILSLLLIAFCCFAAPYLFKLQDFYKDAEDANILDLDYVTNSYHAVNIQVAGIIITIVGAICAAVLFLIPSCEDNMGKAAGFILIVGGLLYIVGWIWYVGEQRAQFNLSVFGISAWDALTDKQREQLTAGWAANVGEAMLMGLSAILLGVDAMLQWYEDEGKRLASNLGVLIAVSALTSNAYWLQVCSDDALICYERDGVEAIAFGYLVLFIVCIVYIVLYICTCCTCDCKDKCLIRVAIAITLVVGGIIASIGYYVYSGGYDSLDDGSDSGDEFVAFYIGYSLLIGGLPIVWALDIALDDVKNR